MCNHLRVAVPLNFLNLYISMSVCGLLEYKMFNRKQNPVTNGAKPVR